MNILTKVSLDYHIMWHILGRHLRTTMVSTNFCVPFLFRSERLPLRKNRFSTKNALCVLCELPQLKMLCVLCVHFFAWCVHSKLLKFDRRQDVLLYSLNTTESVYMGMSCTLNSPFWQSGCHSRASLQTHNSSPSTRINSKLWQASLNIS